MKKIKIIALLGAIIMSVGLLNGFINGSFFDDGSVLLNNPWGIVSIIDLYVGFVLFSLWIIYREASPIKTFIWVLLMMIFGFLTASIYVFIVFHQAKDQPLYAIHGRHAYKYKDVSHHEV